MFDIKLIVPLDIDKDVFEQRVLRETGVKLYYYGTDCLRRKPLIYHKYGMNEKKHFYAIEDIARAMQLDFVSKLI